MIYDIYIYLRLWNETILNICKIYIYMIILIILRIINILNIYTLYWIFKWLLWKNLIYFFFICDYFGLWKNRGYAIYLYKVLLYLTSVHSKGLEKKEKERQNE